MAISNYFNERISAYGAAVSCGVFIGAALSAGSILGVCTWYLAVKNNRISHSDIIGVLSPLNWVYGSSRSESESESDRQEGNKSGKCNRGRLPNCASDNKEIRQQLQELTKRVQILEERQHL